MTKAPVTNKSLFGVNNFLRNCTIRVRVLGNVDILECILQSGHTLGHSIVARMGGPFSTMVKSFPIFSIFWYIFVFLLSCVALFCLLKTEAFLSSCPRICPDNGNYEKKSRPDQFISLSPNTLILFHDFNSF